MDGHNSNHGDAMEWAEDCEKFFLEILAERVKRDPNGSPIFKGTDWIEIDEKIFLKFALRYGPDKLKAKYHRLRIMYTKFSELINHTGVTWDSLSGMVYANDTIWDEFCTRDETCKSFRKKGCKLYPLLTTVFSKSTACGTFHNASTNAPQTLEEEHRLEEVYLGGGDVGGGEARDSDEVEFDGSGSKKRKLEGDILGMRIMKKNNGKEKYDALIDAWSQSMIARKERDLAKAERYKAMASEGASTIRKEEFSIDDCMAVLEAIPGVTSSMTVLYLGPTII